MYISRSYPQWRHQKHKNKKNEKISIKIYKVYGLSQGVFSCCRRQGGEKGTNMSQLGYAGLIKAKRKKEIEAK